MLSDRYLVVVLVAMVVVCEMFSLLMFRIVLVSNDAHMHADTT